MENEIFQALLQIVNYFNDPHFDQRIVAAAGLAPSPNLLPIIVRVGTAGQLNVSDLAHQLGKDYSSVSRQVTKFEQTGLLATHPDPADKRARQITLTAEGTAIFQRIGQARADVLQSALAPLSAADQKQILTSLQTIAKLLGR